MWKLAKSIIYFSHPGRYVPRDQIVTIGDLKKLKQGLLGKFKKLLEMKT